MAFQTLDLPAELMERVAHVAKTANMDVDAYVAKALAFALTWDVAALDNPRLSAGGAGTRAGGSAGSGAAILTNIPTR